MIGNSIKARIAKIEATRPASANHITRIERVIVMPGAKGPVPTGEVIVREVP